MQIAKSMRAKRRNPQSYNRENVYQFVGSDSATVKKQVELIYARAYRNPKTYNLSKMAVDLLALKYHTPRRRIRNS